MATGSKALTQVGLTTTLNIAPANTVIYEVPKLTKPNSKVIVNLAAIGSAGGALGLGTVLTIVIQALDQTNTLWADIATFTLTTVTAVNAGAPKALKYPTGAEFKNHLYSGRLAREHGVDYSQFIDPTTGNIIAGVNNLLTALPTILLPGERMISSGAQLANTRLEVHSLEIKPGG